MSDFGITFDESTVEEPSDDFAPVPKGDYDVIVVKAEVKATAAGDSKLMNLQLKIEGPSHVGRVLFDMIGISTTSQEDGKKDWIVNSHKKLKTLCNATGISKPTDSQLFVGKRAKVSIKVTPAKGDYDAGNEVKRYSADRKSVV